MENLQDVRDLIKPSVWMASIDLKDAYYSIPIHTSFFIGRVNFTLIHVYLMGTRKHLIYLQNYYIYILLSNNFQQFPGERG